MRLDRVRELAGTIEDVDVEGDEGVPQPGSGGSTVSRRQGSSFGLHEPPKGA
jgi:hypothetical protein